MILKQNFFTYFFQASQTDEFYSDQQIVQLIFKAKIFSNFPQKNFFLFGSSPTNINFSAEIQVFPAKMTACGRDRPLRCPKTSHTILGIISLR
jgi:hypothetical protein